MKVLRFLGNLLWLLFTGLESFLGYLILGVFWCITIIGIPFGIQCIKISFLTLWPFGKKIESHGFLAHPIANLIWIIFGGFVLCLGYLLVGVIWCITIIGIPFGRQCFKLARLTLAPFGKGLEKKK